MKQVINYGVEVLSEFLQTNIPSNLWLTPTTWWKGLPCYPSLDGTKAVIRMCNPIKIDNDKGACSWDNVPLTVTNSEGEEVSTLEYLETLFDEVMDLETLNEKLKSAEYSQQDTEM